MNSISIWHWLVAIINVVVVAVPCARILRRTKLSRWWAIQAVFPLVNLAAPAALAGFVQRDGTLAFRHPAHIVTAAKQ